MPGHKEIGFLEAVGGIETKRIKKRLSILAEQKFYNGPLPIASVLSGRKKRMIRVAI
jgi:hypothetical protein